MTITTIKTSGILLAILSLSFNLPSQYTGSEDLKNKTTPDDCSISNFAFTDGEELTYKLYYNWNFIWLSAGEVTFKVKEVGSQYHLSAVGSTYPAYEWFFKVRDHYQAYVDKGTLLPRLSIRNVHEGGYRLYDKLTFDQSAKKITSLRGKTKEEAKEKSYLVKDCVHDVLSIIYYMRNVEFGKMKPGDNVPIRIFMDNEVWPLMVNYKGKEADKKIKGLGDFNTLKFSPEVIAGNVFNEGTEMVIWASDDANRIPLLIESPVSVGSVKAVLKSYKGLKYDLSSKRN